MNTVEKIVEICKDRKIAISRLEKACGFSNGYIRGLKRGDMPSNKLAKVADFLGVSTEYLSGEEEPVYYLNPEVGRLCAQEGIQRHIAPIKSIISGIYNNQRRGIDWHTSAYNGIHKFLHWRPYWHKKWHIKKPLLV